MSSTSSSTTSTGNVEGKTLSSITVKGNSGKSYSFPENFKGYPLTLFYFYPKDDTPGCTRQACYYRDSYSEFTDAGIQIFGVSKDSVESHDAFSQKYTLPFPLIADTDKKLAEALEVTGRDSFLIDPSGKVVAAWKKVSPDTTVTKTLKTALSYLGKEPSPA